MPRPRSSLPRGCSVVLDGPTPRLRPGVSSGCLVFHLELALCLAFSSASWMPGRVQLSRASLCGFIWHFLVGRCRRYLPSRIAAEAVLCSPLIVLENSLARPYTFPAPALGSLRISGSFLWRMSFGNQDLKSSLIATGVVLLLGHLRD